jgi:hypothetical protein
MSPLANDQPLADPARLHARYTHFLVVAGLRDPKS